MIMMQTTLQGQIVIRRDTTFTGAITFAQAVVVGDSTVTVTINAAHITFEQGMTVEWGSLVVHASVLDFRNQSGLALSRGAHLLAYGDCHFNADSVGSIALVQSNGTIENCIIRNMRVTANLGRPGTPDSVRTFTLAESEIRFPLAIPVPMVSGGGNILLETCEFIRTGADTMGQYNNIEINGLYSTIRNCNVRKGGIYVNNGPIANSGMEIADNTISHARVAISGLGIRRVERNTIQYVQRGIEGGTTNYRWNNALIKDNRILNVSERAINIVGDNIVIEFNRIEGNDETGKGILFGYSSGAICNNLIRHFRVRESSLDVDGIALYVKNHLAGSSRSVDITGNVIERCGLHDFAPRDIVTSIVYLESPVNFTGNDIRWCTLGGRASPTNSFAGGPVLDIVVPRLVGLPVIVNHNMIHSNQFYATGVYQPTNTRGTLVAAEFDQRKLEFRGNKLFGVPDTSLGIALFPMNFPNGIVGDSLVFNENTIMHNRVGIGTMYAPNLGPHNVLKQNTRYEIMRYGGYIQPALYALSNNWESADSAWIDSRLYDNEEWSQNGPIVFTGYYNKSYVVTLSVPPTTHFNAGDSLEVSLRVTDSQGAPAPNMPVFLSSSDASAARFKLRSLVTNSNGQTSAMLYGADGGTTWLRAFAGDTTSTSVQVYVQGSTGVDPSNGENLPKEYVMEQNYPNPFNPTTTINYQLPTISHVTLKVFDILGREVATLVDEVEDAGFKSVQWDASGVASGIYFYRLQAGAFVGARKLVFMK